jgi:uncharacterized membrane protein YdcZ (DUF606 family)
LNYYQNSLNSDLAAGAWPLVAGCLSLASGLLSLVTGYWLLVSGSASSKKQEANNQETLKDVLE